MRNGVEVLERARQRIDRAGGPNADASDGSVRLPGALAQHRCNSSACLRPIARCLGWRFTARKHAAAVIHHGDGDLGAANIDCTDGVHVCSKPLSPRTI